MIFHLKTSVVERTRLSRVHKTRSFQVVLFCFSSRSPFLSPLLPLSQRRSVCSKLRLPRCPSHVPCREPSHLVSRWPRQAHCPWGLAAVLRIPSSLPRTLGSQGWKLGRDWLPCLCFGRTGSALTQAASNLISPRKRPQRMWGIDLCKGQEDKDCLAF